MKSKVFFVVSLVILITTNTLASVQNSIPRPDGELINYYLKKSNNDSFSDTLLVLIQGSQCESVFYNENFNKYFSKVIPTADILTVEKYGIDSTFKKSSELPQKYLLYDSPKQRVKDYIQIINKLRKDDKYKKIVLLGGSEGAVVANIISSKLNFINFTISINGGGRWFIDDILHSMKFEIPSEKAYLKASNGFKGFYQKILNSTPFELNMSGHGYKWWKNMLEIDQFIVLSKVTSPVLIVQSDNDENVSPQLVTKLIDLLHKNGKSNIEFLSLNGIDHFFKDSNGDTQLDYLIISIKRWLSSP